MDLYGYSYRCNDPRCNCPLPAQSMITHLNDRHSKITRRILSGEEDNSIININVRTQLMMQFETYRGKQPPKLVYICGCGYQRGLAEGILFHQQTGSCGYTSMSINSIESKCVILPIGEQPERGLQDEAEDTEPYKEKPFIAQLKRDKTPEQKLFMSSNEPAKLPDTPPAIQTKLVKEYQRKFELQNKKIH